MSTIIPFDAFVNIERIELDYSMNQHPIPDQVESIAKQWNNDDISFYLDLQVVKYSFN